LALAREGWYKNRRLEVKAIPVMHTHKLASKHLPSSLTAAAAAALAISSTDLVYTQKKKC
jgi:hypothetical protein